MAMTIHELTTNAAKYGALKADNGQIEIRWHTYRRNDRSYLTFEWRERGVRIEELAPARGFGAKVRAKFSAHAGRHGGAKLYSQWRGLPARISTTCPEHERAMTAELLGKQRILIVEDDWVVAQDTSNMIEELGGAVVGPVGQLAQGLARAESEELGGAILDVNLNGENTFALADRLLADNVPVISQPAMTRRCGPSASLTSPGSRSPSLPSPSRRPFAGYLRTTRWEVARLDVKTIRRRPSRS
jgi:CheY-like chemotaxis protein